MPDTVYQRLRARLGTLYGLSIYGALLLVVFGGLVIPAIVGSYVLIGVQEQKSAKTALNESLQRNADILALGMQESLWNMNADSAQSLVESVMRDPSVLQIQVIGQSDTQFMNVHSPNRPIGNVFRAERDILVRGATPLLSVLKGLFMITSAQGGETITYLAMSPEVEGKTGLYFEKNKAVAPAAIALDDQVAAKLWDESAKMVKL